VAPLTAEAQQPTKQVPRIGVLISGRGSNLQALIAAVGSGALKARLAVVISNKPDAAGLAHAREARIETMVVGQRDYADRAGFDRAIAGALRTYRVGLVCLAGFMRLLGPEFCDAFPNAVLNIHPSLLPAFPGVEAQRQNAQTLGYGMVKDSAHPTQSQRDDRNVEGEHEQAAACVGEAEID